MLLFMHRSLVLLALSCAAVAAAQTAAFIRSDGPTLLLPGAPFHAERVTRTVRVLADGSDITRALHENMARDNDGRVLDESYAEDGTGKHYFVLLDPVAHRQYNWDTGAKEANYTPVRASAHVELRALPLEFAARGEFQSKQAVHATDPLGTRPVAGITATGTREVTTIPAHAEGNSAPLVHSEEVWLAEDLGLVLEEHDQSSLTGTRTVDTKKIERTLLSPDHFRVPPGVEASPFIMGGLASAH